MTGQIQLDVFGSAATASCNCKWLILRRLRQFRSSLCAGVLAVRSYVRCAVLVLMQVLTMRYGQGAAHSGRPASETAATSRPRRAVS